MRTRISPLWVACFGTIFCSVAAAQSDEQLITDPDTGITYRKEFRRIERPVVEERYEPRTRTIYRPEVVTELRDEHRTVYTPSTHLELQPRLHGWWNPFRQPTWAYHVVPRTSWQARSETVQRPHTVTRWVRETRTEEVPTKVVRLEHEEQIVLHPVESEGRAPKTQVASAPKIRRATVVGGVGRLAGDPPRRSTTQRGIPATELGSDGGTQMATAPATLWR